VSRIEQTSAVILRRLIEGRHCTRTWGSWRKHKESSAFRTVFQKQMKVRLKPPAVTDVLLSDAGTLSHFGERETIFKQGTPNGSIYYVQNGLVMLTVTSKGRRPVVLSVLPARTFFGEDTLSHHPAHLSTASTLVPTSVLAIKKNDMVRLLDGELQIATLFRNHMLAANTRYREDLMDVMVNSASQRLARALLRLANISSSGSPRKASIPRISQLALAEMVGTTRSRVNFFMNSFRKSGYISYNGMLEVRSTLREALSTN